MLFSETNRKFTCTKIKTLKFNNIQSCHLGPEISPEQFIPEHFFIVLTKGSMVAFDGNKNYQVQEGEYYIARKNHLIRYTKHKINGAFEKIIITFDEAFLRKFLQKNHYSKTAFSNDDSFLEVKENLLIKNFIQSLAPYYADGEKIDDEFSDIKREELLLILLKNNPDLANVFFNFVAPEKIDLEEFMLRNFRFNIHLERFAYLTGRSLSSFKRDFQKIFGMNPGKWLIQKRLEEAHFLLQNEKRKPNDIYLDLGFEDLSHFSFAFKKEFGISPSEVLA